MNVDAAGVAHEANSALSRLVAAANAPIFSYLGNFFGEGIIVGGPMHSVVGREGALAAAVALRLLDGEKAGDAPKTSDYIRNPRNSTGVKMQRWGIS